MEITTHEAAANIASGAEELLRSLKATDDPNVPYDSYLPAVRSKSHGYVHRIRGIITCRMHHLQSGGEKGVLLMLDMSGRPLNIREGFPIPRSLTEPIAESRGIKHPFNRFANENATMSVDFIITEPDGTWTAIDYKPSAHLLRKRVREKLFLARLALAEVGVKHVVMTEKDLPAQLIANLEFLHPFALPIDPPPLPAGKLVQASNAMRAALADGRLSVHAAAVQVQRELNYPTAKLARTAFWMIAHRHWHVDLHQPAHPEKPLIFKYSP